MRGTDRGLGAPGPPLGAIRFPLGTPEASYNPGNMPENSSNISCKVCGSGRFLCDPLYLAVFYASVFHEVDKVPWISFLFIRDLVRAFLCTTDKRI